MLECLFPISDRAAVSTGEATLEGLRTKTVRTGGLAGMAHGVGNVREVDDRAHAGPRSLSGCSAYRIRTSSFFTSSRFSVNSTASADGKKCEGSAASQIVASVPPPSNQTWKRVPGADPDGCSPLVAPFQGGGQAAQIAPVEHRQTDINRLRRAGLGGLRQDFLRAHAGRAPEVVGTLPPIWRSCGNAALSSETTPIRISGSAGARRGN